MKKIFIGDPCYDDSFEALDKNPRSEEGEYAGVLEIDINDVHDIKLEFDKEDECYVIRVPKGFDVVYNGEDHDYGIFDYVVDLPSLSVDSGSAGIWFEKPTEEEYDKHYYSENKYPKEKGYRVGNGYGDGEHKLRLEWV